MSRFIRLVAVLALLVPASITTVAVVAPTAFAATGQICDQYGSTTQGNYIVMNNRWGTTATQCINVTSSGFQIVQQDGTGNLSGAPVSYPAIYVGCHYSNCSPNTNLPARLSSITSAQTNVSISYPGSGTYDAAYDIWLNADTNVSGVQDTEIMIWLNHTGSIQPIGSQTGTVSIGGKNWNVWTGNNGGNNVVSYVANPAGVTSFNVDAKPFLTDAITRGSGFGTSSWYLTSMQMGFEPWIGGVGLAVNSFSATINTGNPPPATATPVRTTAPTATPVRTTAPTATPVRTTAPTATPVRTTAPTGTPNGSASCTATYSIGSSWATGFTANVTVKAGSAAIKTWKVTWTWGGNQAITNSWNATVTSSGKAVTASNLSYNGALAAAASTSLGFQATYSGTNTAPTLTCSAT